MKIIISEQGKNARELDSTSIERERFLQDYIRDNPQTIPIDEINENLQLLVLAREFPTGSGPIDALGVDQEGNIYIIETKLAKNNDKRKVLAQILDYGAALWRTYENRDEFIGRLEQSAEELFHSTLGNKISDFFAGDVEDVAVFLQTVRQNISTGDFRFVVLMDHIEDRLKNLITFVNRNSQFTIYAVEMEFYKFDKYEILIPKLFGAEVTKEVSVPKPSSGNQKWDEAAFFAKATNELSASEVESLRRLYEFSSKYGRVEWKTNQTGTFTTKFTHFDPKRAFYTVGATGMLELNLGWHEDEKANDIAMQMKDALRQLPGLDNGENFQMQHISIRAENWSPQVDNIIEAIGHITQQETE
jgi:hypothetical protein